MKLVKKLQTILVVAAGLIVLFLVFKIKYLLILAIALVVIGTLSDAFTNGFTRIWFKISLVLGWINTKILLGLIFFLLLCPLALLMKLFGKSFLNLKNGHTTYFSERNHLYRSNDLENIW